MALQYLRDDHFRVIGSIETDSTGKQVARDARFHRVGDYDPRTNQTRDEHYRLAGTGNLLAAMIWRTAE
ncbi:hypothetical protein [Paraburkholderia sp. MM5477-R1]|jgi:hypothetical protein|uniref:hypothetical protein n=1 Tax=Paraburkholderia sp. MM5477-R1 TaxID=2991062 RepID=UPI003D1B98C3